jgi:hypothetical protein
MIMMHGSCLYGSKNGALITRSVYAARYNLNAWKIVPLNRFSAATDFELGPISRLFPSSRFSAGFSENSARVFSQLPRD